MQRDALTQVDGVEDPPLFPPSLISPEVSSSLPEGYTMRPLRRSDYHGGMAYCCS
jgi:glucosamine-phosphate N-acetyltransferase